MIFMIVLGVLFHLHISVKKLNRSLHGGAEIVRDVVVVTFILV